MVMSRRLLNTIVPHLADVILMLPFLRVDFHQSTGTVTLTELKEVMKSLGQNPTDAELVEMINSVDDNGDNAIDFEEFLVLMKSRIGERDPDKELRDAFKVFDTNGSGSISRDELKRLMTQLGQNLSEAELDAMMDEVDTDGDGEISFEEGKGSFDFSVSDVPSTSYVVCLSLLPLAFLMDNYSSILVIAVSIIFTASVHEPGYCNAFVCCC